GLAIAALSLVALGGPDGWTVLTMGGFVLATVAIVLAVETPERFRMPGRVVLTWIRRVRRRPTDDVPEVVDGVVRRLSTVRLRRRDWVTTAVYAVVAIATDFAALFCCLHAVTG